MEKPTSIAQSPVEIVWQSQGQARYRPGYGDEDNEERDREDRITEEFCFTFLFRTVFGCFLCNQKFAFHGCRMRLFWSDYVVPTIGKPDTAKSAAARLKPHGIAENTCTA